MARRLESESQGKLDEAWLVDLRGNLAKVAVSERLTRIAKLSPVEYVEEFGAEREFIFSIVSEREILHGCKIPIGYTKCAQIGIHTRLVAKREWRRL
jgi:hypothetical protein